MPADSSSEPRQPAVAPPRAPWTIPLAQGPIGAGADRAIAVVFAGAAITAVAVLWPLTADEQGFDTHTQLGLEPCGWPIAYGMPCPTCGCTTAATHVVHGSLIDAFVTQPFGAALAILGLFLGLHALYCLARGHSFVDLVVRINFGRWLLGGTLLLLASWGYKCLMM